MCKLVEKVIGVDISGQTGGQTQPPENFELVLYDGYTLNVPDNSVDMAYSYQFIEHLHPEDVGRHFPTILRVLRPGGVYICDTPQGFHCKEWRLSAGWLTCCGGSVTRSGSSIAGANRAATERSTN